MPNVTTPNFIDLFSGAGGLLRGFIDAKYTPVFSVEMWEPAVETHRKNYPNVSLMNRDIRSITNEEIAPFKGKVDVIVGGPPCQGFSTIGKRLVKDPRNVLVFEFIRFINTIRPKAFLMENVRGLLSSGRGAIKSAIEEEFKQIGYAIDSKVICAADYGVPQIRHRIFFIGFRDDLGILPNFPLPTHEQGDYITVGEVIDDLFGKENEMDNHVPMKHNKTVEGRIKCIREGEGIPSDGLPQEVSNGSRSDYANNTIKNFSHVYRRLSRQRPATTMVPGHNAFPLHPVANRSLTVREAARIQTFPDDVVFCGTRQNQCIQVGNAVPVRLANVLAQHIKLKLNEVNQ
jgi:DNA (cytosine-5)-methyltransferase 1